MNDADRKALNDCYRKFSGSPATAITPLKPHASDRRIYRLTGSKESVIGVVNDNHYENAAFVYIADQLRQIGLPVPIVYAACVEQGSYLVEDLGDTTLLDELESCRSTESPLAFPTKIELLYKDALTCLARCQILGAKSMDFSRCYPESHFSAAALQRDMENFSNELVARLLPDFDRAALIPEYRTLVSFLTEADSHFFLYRDFQSRNIMVRDGKLFLIDFQGARRGPLQYDVVSLLYQASAKIPQSMRDNLLDHYLSYAASLTSLSDVHFRKHYTGFIVSRMLQVLGVYGTQGLGAGKEYFSASIPEAVRTLQSALSSATLPLELPMLRSCCDDLERVTTV